MRTFRRKQSYPTYPPIIGDPGGGLNNATWAANEAVAAVGKKGEVATAEILNRLASKDGPTVMHDLMVPLQGITANIDHVVVAGRHVWLIDSKQWRPAFYWTFRGRTRRGTERFESAAGKSIADSQTMSLAHRSISAYLYGQGIKAQVHTPYVVVWPSSASKRLSVFFYRPRGAKAMTGPQFRWRSRYIVGHMKAHPAIVRSLRHLVVNPDAPTGKAA